MTDELNPALEAGVEDVTEAVITEEVTDGTPDAGEQGQEVDQPAKDEQSEEIISRSKARRARRKAEMEQSRAATETAERELLEANDKVARLEQALHQAQPPEQADNESYEEYQARLSAFHSLRLFDQRSMSETKSDAEQRQSQVDSMKQQSQVAARSMFEEACGEARERYADFDAVTQTQNFTVTQEMGEMIMGMDAGPDVYYHLGKNPDEAARIAQLPTVQAAIAIGRIEAGLAMPKPITKSNAPTPIAPVRGSGAPAKDPADMSPAEYRKWSEAGGKFS